MVTLKLQGGLCNQMFQTAFIYSYAKKHDLEFAISRTVVNPHLYGKSIAYEFPGIKYFDGESGLPDYHEQQYNFKEIPKADDINFIGYFQSARYFDDYRDEVIEAFDLEIKKILQGWCGIHVRRGDYLKFPEHHPVQGMDYFFSAIGLVKQRLGIKNFVVISNDIPWCKETFDMLPHFEFEYSEGKDEIEDLKLFASCTHQIGSNSSYSWWGHYLNPNPNKLGIFPHTWFGPALGNNTKDLYVNSMIRI